MRTVVAAIVTAGDAAADRTGQLMVDAGGAWQRGHQSPTWWTEQGGGRPGKRHTKSSVSAGRKATGDVQGEVRAGAVGLRVSKPWRPRDHPGAALDRQTTAATPGRSRGRHLAGKEEAARRPRKDQGRVGIRKQER